jgi:hypothetical protein
VLCLVIQCSLATLSDHDHCALMCTGLGGFVACNALSQRNEDPIKASRPWDMERDGFVLGEGAGVLLLEELEHAKSRGAEIYAEFLGGSFTCDAYHMTEPHPDGAGVVLCIEKALAQAGVSRQDVNYVNAHATSTQAGDLQEYKALIRSFGKNAELKVNSTKSMIGHLLGASGGVEAIATVQVCKLRAICGWDMKVQVYILELSSLKAIVPFCCVRCFSVKLLDRCNMDLVIGFHDCTLCLILILDYSKCSNQMSSFHFFA